MVTRVRGLFCGLPSLPEMFVIRSCQTRCFGYEVLRESNPNGKPPASGLHEGRAFPSAVPSSARPPGMGVGSLLLALCLVAGRAVPSSGGSNLALIRPFATTDSAEHGTLCRSTGGRAGSHWGFFSTRVTAVPDNAGRQDSGHVGAQWTPPQPPPSGLVAQGGSGGNHSGRVARRTPPAQGTETSRWWREGFAFVDIEVLWCAKRFPSEQ